MGSLAPDAVALGQLVLLQLVNIQRCKVCGKPVKRSVYRTCSRKCAGILRKMGKSAAPPTSGDPWPEWMAREQPFARFERAYPEWKKQ